MSKSWKLDTYWRPREESTLAVAERLEKFLEMASAACPNLGRWYQTGSPKSKHWGQAINTFDKKAVEGLVAKKSLKNDYGGPFEGGGYAFGLVNAITDEISFAHMSIFCGMKSPIEHYHSTNKILIGLSDDLSVHGLRTDDDLKRYMAAILISWEPDWAVLYRHGSPGFNRAPEDGPFLDRMAWAGAPFLVQAVSLGDEDGVTMEVLAGGALYTRLDPSAMP